MTAIGSRLKDPPRLSHPGVANSPAAVDLRRAICGSSGHGAVTFLVGVQGRPAPKSTHQAADSAGHSRPQKDALSDLVMDAGHWEK